MTSRGLFAIALLLGAAGLTFAGCGSSGASTPSSSAASATTQATTTKAAPAPPSGLTPDAASVGTGDIPDNQVFLTFRNRRAGYAMKYPEGWVRQGAGVRVTFQDKNNVVRVVAGPGSLPTVRRVQAEMARLGATEPGLRASTPTMIGIGATPAIKVVYTTRSAPNAVTGKRVTLTVDRYYLAHAGRLAVVDLGTPQGVDNVDAYRLMIESFRWS